MKGLFFLASIILVTVNAIAQVTRVAILDFENLSGIAKYDGLGKAMSSMLISDIESNVSPKRLQLVERSQIQKILKEQKFQASGNVNKNTAVQAGKILGVKFLLIGDVFVLNDQLVVNARLTNTESGDIVFSKKQEGRMTSWLSLKTNIARDLATNLSMPFTEPRTNDATIEPAFLTTYANAINEKDKGNMDKAETLINVAKEFNSDFGYLDDLRDEIQTIKKQLSEQGRKIDVLEKSGGRVINAVTYEDFLNNKRSTLTDNNEKKSITISVLTDFPEMAEKEFYSWQLHWALNKIESIQDLNAFIEIFSKSLSPLSRSKGKRVGEKLLLDLIFWYIDKEEIKGLNLIEFERLFFNYKRIVDGLETDDRTKSFIKMEFITIFLRRNGSDRLDALVVSKNNDIDSTELLKTRTDFKHSKYFISAVLELLKQNNSLLSFPSKNLINGRIHNLENSFGNKDFLNDKIFKEVEDLFDVQLVSFYRESIPLEFDGGNTRYHDLETEKKIEYDKIFEYMEFINKHIYKRTKTKDLLSEITLTFRNPWMNDFRFQNLISSSNREIVIYQKKEFWHYKFIDALCQRVGIPYFLTSINQNL